MDTSRLFKVIDTSFRRSSFGCYRRYASILSTHLQSMLMLSTEDKRELEKMIRAKRDGLKQRLAFVGASECGRCSTIRSVKRS
jgi:hypothetical protein